MNENFGVFPWVPTKNNEYELKPHLQKLILHNKMKPVQTTISDRVHNYDLNYKSKVMMPLYNDSLDEEEPE